MKIKNFNLFVVIVLCSLLFVFIQAISAESSQNTIQYRIGTASTTGAAYPIGGMMASILSRNMEGYNFTAESTGGSTENIRRIHAGEIHLGTCASDSTYFGYKGIQQFENDGPQNILAFSSHYLTPFQIVVLENSDIHKISDLENKKVAIGAPGSGTNIKAKILLENYDLEDNKNIQLRYLGWDETTNALIDGTIDAGMLAVGLPAPAIQQLAASHDIRLIPFSSEELEKLTDEVPFFSKTIIPAGTYNGVENDVLTFGCGNTIVIAPDLPEDIVYKMAKILYSENFEDLQSAHSAMLGATLETLPDTPIPLHPGAEKYYREMGYID